MFAALAVARDLQNATRVSTKKIVRSLRKIHTAVIDVDGHHLTARSPLDDDAAVIVKALESRH